MFSTEVKAVQQPSMLPVTALLTRPRVLQRGTLFTICQDADVSQRGSSVTIFGCLMASETRRFLEDNDPCCNDWGKTSGDRLLPIRLSLKQGCGRFFCFRRQQEKVGVPVIQSTVAKTGFEVWEKGSLNCV